MAKPKISVIVPAYNEEKYIAKTLEALKSQTYKDYEIIVVNNNSKDRTGEIAKQHVKNVYLETKKGYHNAVNRGVKESKGEYITVCDADTLYPAKWLEKAMKEFEKRPELVAVYGTMQFNDYNFLINFLSGPIFGLSLFFIKLTGSDNTPGFNFIIRKDAYLKVGGYNPEIYNGVFIDIELGDRLHKIGKMKLMLNNKVYSSARRFRKEGLFKALWYHITNVYSIHSGQKPKMSYEEYNK